MKILIFCLAYNAEHTIDSVLHRIRDNLKKYDTSVLVLDDGSTDATAKIARAFKRREKDFPYDLQILRNQKLLAYLQEHLLQNNWCKI